MLNFWRLDNLLLTQPSSIEDAYSVMVLKIGFLY